MVADSSSIVTGVILAAGRGSRLQALTDDRPKGLVQVAGRSLVEWQLGALNAANVRSLAIVTGYRWQDYDRFQVKTIHNQRWVETNMVASMLRALETLDGPIIFSYSDILYDSCLVEKVLHSKADFAVAYDTEWLDIWSQRFADPLSDAESFKIGADKKIIEIGQAAHHVKEVEGQFMGLFKVSSRAAGWIRDLLAEHPDRVDTLDTTGLINLLIAKGFPIVGVPTAGNWMEIDNRQDLELAETMMTSGVLVLDKMNAVGS